MHVKRPALKALRRDQRGVAAIEFALIAPVAILLYCGFAELTLAMMAERRAAHTASVVADLVSQTPSVTTAQMTDIFNVANAIIYPFASTPVQMRVSSVAADAQGVAHIAWSQGHGMTAYKSGDPASGFPANLLAPGESVIQADVSYAYTSPLGMTLPNALTFKDTFYLKPRRSASVALLP